MKNILSGFILFFASAAAMSATIYDVNTPSCDSYGRGSCTDGYVLKVNNQRIRGGADESNEFSVVGSGFFTFGDNSANLELRISNGARTYDMLAEFVDISSTSVSGPRRRLRNRAYVDRNGPVDPATWFFTNNANNDGFAGILFEEGTLSDGFQQSDFDAALFEFSLISRDFQLGFGANNKNSLFGAEARLQFIDANNGRARGNGDLVLGLQQSEIQPVPVPGAFVLFLSATAGLTLIRGRKNV